MKNAGTKWGLIAGLVSAVLTIVTYMMPDMSPVLGIVSLAGWILFVVLGIKEARENQGGYIKFSKAFGVGMTVTLISLAIGGAAGFIYAKVDPAVAENYNAQLEEKMGDAPEESRDFAMQFASMGEPGSITSLLTTLVGGLICGAIISLIIAAIMKREPPVGMNMPAPDGVPNLHS